MNNIATLLQKYLLKLYSCTTASGQNVWYETKGLKNARSKQFYFLFEAVAEKHGEI